VHRDHEVGDRIVAARREAPPLNLDPPLRGNRDRVDVVGVEDVVAAVVQSDAANEPSNGSGMSSRRQASAISPDRRPCSCCVKTTARRRDLNTPPSSHRKRTAYSGRADVVRNRHEVSRRGSSIPAASPGTTQGDPKAKPD
jgi:hypothetical protein